jgi:peroxiredoxin
MTADTDPLDAAFRRICVMEAPLGERLALFTAAVAEHGEPFARAYDSLVAQITRAAAGSTAPKIGAPMPPFLLPDHAGSLISLEALVANGPVVISFNRGHWCEYCQLELRAFAAAHAEFAKRGVKVVSILPERGAYTRKVRALTGGTLTVLSDLDNGYALDVGVVMWLGDEVRGLYQKFGLDVARYQGNASWFVPIPATFVLDGKGTVIGRKVDPDFRHRLDIEEILRTLPLAQ